MSRIVSRPLGTPTPANLRAPEAKEPHMHITTAHSTSLRSRRRLRRPAGWAALLVVLALLLAACGGGRSEEKRTDGGDGGDGAASELIDTSGCASDPSVEVTGDTIKLGTSLPQSGLYSAFQEILRGEEAYFRYVNEELGGVKVGGKTYKIELVNKDDQYQADKTVQNVNGLINDDKVFALFNVVGTKNNLAIRDLVNEQCIPNLFAATGSPAWGNTKYPWLLGTMLVPYPLEMQAFVDYLKQEKPDATIAVLRASDDFGRAYADTLKRLVGGTDLRIVKEATYNPEVSDTKAQVTSLAATEADAFVLGATLLACPNALQAVREAGWQPIIYMSGTCTSKTLMNIAGPAADGVLSVGSLMDPNDPRWASDPRMRLYKEKVPQYAPEADVTNGIVAYGWTTAAFLVETLQSSPKLTRLAVMETARTLDVEGVGLQLPEASLSVDEDDWFLGEIFTMVRYDAGKGYFVTEGDVLDFSGKTRSITPPDLITG